MGLLRKAVLYSGIGLAAAGTVAADNQLKISVDFTDARFICSPLLPGMTEADGIRAIGFDPATALVFRGEHHTLTRETIRLSQGQGASDIPVGQPATRVFKVNKGLFSRPENAVESIVPMVCVDNRDPEGIDFYKFGTGLSKLLGK